MKSQPTFQSSLRASADLALKHGIDLLSEFALENGFRDTIRSALGLAAVQIALVDVLKLDYGIVPHGILGHSAGEPPLPLSPPQGQLVLFPTYCVGFWYPQYSLCHISLSHTILPSHICWLAKAKCSLLTESLLTYPLKSLKGKPFAESPCNGNVSEPC
jgi:hypothetical protein